MFCYPNFSNKAITFTIDDGNIPLDKIFIDYVRPAGITGCFNLCGHYSYELSDSELVEFYRGFEIANHCYLHPMAFNESESYPPVSEDKFDPKTANKDMLYKDEIDGLYHWFYKTYWRVVADDRCYLELTKKSQQVLENIFGKGNIKGFVWPYGRQNNEAVFTELTKFGFNSIRKTGCTKGFSLPEDRMEWSYAAHNLNLLSRAEEYEALDPEGKLTMFCFGVHSHDFRNSDNWCDLEEFCKKYGNRPDDFWYATVSEIFEYEDAVKQVIFDGERYINRSRIPVYAIINNERVVISPEE